MMRIIGWIGMAFSFVPIYEILKSSSPTPDDPGMNLLGMATTQGAAFASILWGAACLNVIIISVLLLAGAGLIQVIIDIQDNTYHP
jgi:hypothetical protein